MSISMLTNSGAIFNKNALDKTNRALTLADQQLATGLKTPDPSANPSASAIGIKLDGTVTLSNIVQSIASQGEALMSLGVGVLNSSVAILNRMSELAAQAKSSTIDATARSAMQLELVELRSQLDRLVETKWGTSTLFGLESQLSGTIQIGVNDADTLEFAFSEMTSAALEISDIDLSGENTENATIAYTALTAAKQTMLDQLAQVAAYKNRLTQVGDFMSTLSLNLGLAKSTYTDANIAESLIDAQRASGLVDSGSSAFSQSVQMFQKLAQLVKTTLN